MEKNNLRIISSSVESPEQSIIIGLAITPEEKIEIYRFRYQIYIEQMSKSLEGADHTNKLLYDELDEWGFQLYAKIGSELIGTARLNIGSPTDFPEELATSLHWNIFQNFPTETGDHNIAFCAKLMIAPRHRSSPAVYLLIAKIYELCYLNHVQFAFMVCNFFLLRLYEQMGFHRYCKNFNLGGLGLMAPLVCVVNDTDHLRAVRSPLLRIARRMGAAHTQAVDWFHEKNSEFSHMYNSQIVQEDELWSILCKNLNCPPTEAIAILRELSSAEAKKFLHCCAIFVQCEPGDLITRQGDISYAYNILVTGKLKSLTFLRPTKYYDLPGQHFGANGLTEHDKNNEDIVAIDSSEILVLSSLAFPKFFSSHQDIAHKIVQRLRTESKLKRLSM